MFDQYLRKNMVKVITVFYPDMEIFKGKTFVLFPNETRQKVNDELKNTVW